MHWSREEPAVPDALPCPRSAPFLAAALVAALLAGGAAAQGVIRDGTARYRIGAIGTAQRSSVDCDLTADPALVADTLVEHWWFYRVEGDADETAFRDDGGLTQRYAGRHADLFWADVDGRGLFRAHAGHALFATGPTGALLYDRLTIFNSSARPLRMSLFHYVDVDLCAPATHRATGTRGLQFVDGGCTRQTVSIEAIGASRYEVREQDGTECGILDPGVALLADRGLPFQGTDHTAALQWDVVLPAGEQFTAWVSLEHNPGGCPPAQTELYGTGRSGTFGVPTISSTLPRMGGTATLSIANTLPNTGGILAFGFGRAEFPLGPLQVQVLGGPRGLDFDSVVVFTGAAGRVDLRLRIPTLESYCGRQINWQCFLLDAGAPAPLPFSQTRALEWLVGW